jgi:hypothetical protein
VRPDGVGLPGEKVRLPAPGDDVGEELVGGDLLGELGVGDGARAVDPLLVGLEVLVRQYSRRRGRS